jgi:hypothetical protein
MLAGGVTRGPRGARMTPGTVVPAVVAASSILACAVVLADAPTPLRALVVAWFTLVIPGGAVVPMLGLSDRVAELMLCLAVSLALDLGVASALLYAQAWSPAGGIVVLAAFALAGAGYQAGRLDTATRRDGVSSPAAAGPEERTS